MFLINSWAKCERKGYESVINRILLRRKKVAYSDARTLKALQKPLETAGFQAFRVEFTGPMSK